MGGFTVTLQAAHHHNGLALIFDVQGLGFLAAHQLGQFLVDDLDNLLGGGQAFHHFLAHGALRNLRAEILCDFVVDDQLMDELVRIKQAVEVDETLLVVDAMSGQEAVNVAKTFNEKVGISGVVLTKTDGDTRGGAALSVLAVTGKPIYFQGTGEKLDALEPFYPARMSSRILGMGDVLSLIEKAQTLQNDKEAEEAAKRMMANKFDMNDMLTQFAQIRKMGGASALLAMMPGANQISSEQMDQIDEKALPHIEAIIFCMASNWRSSLFTSSTVWPLPAAMRRLRLGLMMEGCARSSGVME